MKYIKFFILISIINLSKLNDDIIDISQYDYPKPIDTEDEYNIAILGTNDIHGAYFPSLVNLTNLNITYYSGGLVYMGKYINLLREEWKEQFIWLDAGDQFQGALENNISDGSIITDFYNIMNLTDATFGNHEWDFGREFIEKRMNESNFNYIIGNLQEISTRKKEFLPKQLRTKIINVGKIKVGIIGLTTVQTPITSAANLTDIDFLDYSRVIEELSTDLRNKTDVIILLAHFGMDCSKQSHDIIYTLKMHNSSSNYSDCSNDAELYILLKNLKKGLIDVVVSGHTHQIVHQWVFNYPVISSINNGKYSNIMYLSFKKDSDGKYKYLPDKTLIEGPLPICDKVFNKTLHCNTIDESKIEEEGDLVNYKFHNIQITKEPKLKNLTDKWEKILEEYKKQIIAISDGPLEHKRNNETALGNLMTNIMKSLTKSDIAIMNSGGFRTVWSEGGISVADIYNMFPFNNFIVSFEMTGLEIKRMLKIIQKGNFAFYPTSGDKETVLIHQNKKNLIDVVLFDGLYEIPIINDKNYTVSTLDFCIINGGDDFADVVSWYKLRKLIKYGDTKSNIIRYLKSMKYIYTKNLIDKKNPRLRIIEDKKRKFSRFRMRNFSQIKNIKNSFK